MDDIIRSLDPPGPPAHHVGRDDQLAAAVAMGTGRVRGRRFNLDGRWVSTYLPRAKVGGGAGPSPRVGIAR